MLKKNLLSTTLLTVCMLISMAQAYETNATLKTVFTNEFYQNAQKNFVPKFCQHVEEQLTDILIYKDRTFWIPNLFGIVVSLEHLDVRHACISVIDKQIITLGNNGQVKIDLQKLILDLSASYKVGTNPSLNYEESGAVYLFSYGTFMLETSLKVDGEGEIWADKTKGFDFSGTHIDIKFTGSYVTQAFASIFSYFANQALGVLETQAFLLNQHERGLIVIHDALNFLLADVPTKFNVTDNLFIVGGLYSTPKVVANDSLSLEFNYHMREFENMNRHKNLAVFKDAPRLNDTMHFYQVEISVTEYLLQSALTSLYSQGLLVSEPVVLDASAMGSFRSALQFQYTLKNEFINAGFDIQTMFCQVVPFVANHTWSEPVVTISKDKFFALNITMMIDMQCSTNQKDLNANTTQLNGTEKNMTYEHVFTLLMKPAYISTKLNATNASLEIAMQNITLELEFDHITRSSIGPIDGGVNDFIHYYVQPFIKPAVEFEMETRPIPGGELIMNATGLAWLDFDESHIEFEDHYFTLYLTPVFEHPHKRNKYNERTGPALALPIVDTKENVIPESHTELTLDEQIDMYLADSTLVLDQSENVLMI